MNIHKFLYAINCQPTNKWVMVWDPVKKRVWLFRTDEHHVNFCVSHHGSYGSWMNGYYKEPDSRNTFHKTTLCKARKFMRECGDFTKALAAFNSEEWPE